MRPTPNDAAGELQSRLLSSLSPFEVIILVCVINTAFHPETPLHSALTSTMTSRRNRGFLPGIRRMEIISLSCYRIHLKSHSTSLALSKSRSQFIPDAFRFGAVSTPVMRLHSYVSGCLSALVTCVTRCRHMSDLHQVVDFHLPHSHHRGHSSSRRGNLQQGGGLPTPYSPVLLQDL